MEYRSGGYDTHAGYILIGYGQRARGFIKNGVVFVGCNYVVYWFFVCLHHFEMSFLAIIKIWEHELDGPQCPHNVRQGCRGDPVSRSGVGYDSYTLRRVWLRRVGLLDGFDHFFLLSLTIGVGLQWLIGDGVLAVIGWASYM
jgi:hypothetical protein